MTDIDGRMNAWHGATQHPERSSRFLKGGQPLTPFKNKDALEDLRFDDDYSKGSEYQYDALDAIDAYRNKQAAFETDAEKDELK